jgi:flagellar hook-basal body complex protein FliE
MANIAQAANAYSATALNAINKVTGAGSPGENGADGGAFGDLVKQGLQNAVDLQHKSETVSGKALAGKADMTDVLQAVTDAEMALNTVLAVRDKVVQAYNNIMSTQI